MVKEIPEIVDSVFEKALAQDIPSIVERCFCKALELDGEEIEEVYDE